MNWLVCIGIAVVCAALGCVAAGLVASVCVDWYRIPSMEGAAGYYVVFIALGGGIAGFLIGAITGFVLLQQGKSFGLALGIATGIIAGTALVSLGLSWLLADIPPKIAGEELFVDLEVRCPINWKPTNKVRAGENTADLVSYGADGSVRRGGWGRLSWEDVRFEDDRTVLVGSIYLRSSSGNRSLSIKLGDDPVGSARIPLPGHPKEEDQEWSEWLPLAVDGEAGGGFEARYRVVRESAFKQRSEDEKRRIAEDRERRMKALTPDSPMEEWLLVWDAEKGYVDPSGSDMDAAIKRVLRTRADELVRLASAEEDAMAIKAMQALQSLSPLPDEIEDKLTDALPPIRDRLARACEAYNAEDPNTVEIGIVRARFNAWINTWGQFRIQRVLPAPAGLAMISALRERCPEYTDLRRIAEDAEFHRKVWTPEGESSSTPSADAGAATNR